MARLDAAQIKSVVVDKPEKEATSSGSSMLSPELARRVVVDEPSPAPSPQAKSAQKPAKSGNVYKPGVIDSDPSATRSFLENAVNEGVFGFGPEIEGAMYGALYGREYGDSVKNAMRARLDVEKNRHPIATAAGDITGGIAGTLVPGMAAGRFLKGAKFASNALRAATRAGRAASVGTGAAGAIYGGETGGPENALIGGAAGYLAPRHIGEALAGAAYGALSGAGHAGSGQRGRGAAQGAVVGGALGGILPYVGGTVKALGRGLDRGTGYKITETAQKAHDAWNSLLGRPKGHHLTAPERAAAHRMAEAAGHDIPTHGELAATTKLREEAGVKEMKGYQMDSDSLRSLFRVAARKAGAASKLAGRERRAVGGALPGQIREQANLFDPAQAHMSMKGEEIRTAGDMIEDLNARRSLAAATQFRAPYAQPVQPDERVIDAISSNKMRGAMDMVIKNKMESFEDPEGGRIIDDIRNLKKYLEDKRTYPERLRAWEESQKGDGWDLSGVSDDGKKAIEGASTWSPEARDQLISQLGGTRAQALPMPEEPKIPEVSAGTLDNIQRQAGLTSKALKSTALETKETHELGSHVGHRQSAIDEFLDSQAHLKPARANYRDYSRRMAAVADGEKHLLIDTPEEFQSWMKKLTEGVEGPEAQNLAGQIRNDLRLSLREALTGKGSDVVNASAMIRRLSGSDINFQANVKAVLGEEEANRLFQAADIIREDFQHAQFVGGAGSNTAEKLEHAKTIENLGKQLSPLGAAHQILNDLISQGTIMTKEEAEALVRFSHGEPEEILKLIETHPEGVLSKAIRTGTARAAAGFLAPRAYVDEDGKIKYLQGMLTDSNGNQAPQYGPEKPADFEMPPGPLPSAAQTGMPARGQTVFGE